MNCKLLASILTSAALLCASQASAQEDYRFDAGGALGFTGYLGDANTANLFSSPSWTAEGIFRYIVNPRFALKSGLYIGGLRGDSSKMTNVFPNDETYKFSTTFYEFSEIVEFNFLNYGMGEYYRKLRRFTPYIAAGMGLTAWNTDGNSGAAFTIPLGFGIKYKPSRRLNLGLEFLMKKTFTDRLDGPALDDPIGIKSSFMKNTDWYSTITFSVTYEFSKRCAVCNYKD